MEEVKVEEVQPLVSIICTAYNHEPYIQQALDGFVMQQCDFPFEIVIHDDASTDNTANIIRAYVDKYPHLFKPIFQIENQYSQGKDITKLLYNETAKGKYIAICEGDDYWTDPYKLQKQVGFLEANREYGLVHTQCYVFEQKKQTNLNICLASEHTEFKELLCENAIATLTTCFKKSLWDDYMKEIVPEQYHWAMGDYPMWLWMATHSKIKYINDITATYRVLKNSTSHSQDVSKRYKFFTEVWNVRLFFGKKYLSEREYDNLYLKYIKTFSVRAFFFKDKMKQLDILDYYKIHNRLTWILLKLFYGLDWTFSSRVNHFISHIRNSF